MHEWLEEAEVTRQASQVICGEKSKSKNEKIHKHQKLLESPGEDWGFSGKSKDIIHLSTKQNFELIDVPDHLATSPEVVQVPGTIGEWDWAQNHQGPLPKPKGQEVVEGAPLPQKVVQPYKPVEDVSNQEIPERRDPKWAIIGAAIGLAVASAVLTGAVSWWPQAGSLNRKFQDTHGRIIWEASQLYENMSMEKPATVHHLWYTQMNLANTNPALGKVSFLGLQKVKN